MRSLLLTFMPASCLFSVWKCVEFSHCFFVVYACYSPVLVCEIMRNLHHARCVVFPGIFQLLFNCLELLSSCFYCISIVIYNGACAASHFVSHFFTCKMCKVRIDKHWDFTNSPVVVVSHARACGGVQSVHFCRVL